MKRKFLAFFAIALIIGFTSFISKSAEPKSVSVYFIYFGSGSEAVMSNYSQTTVKPATLTGTDILNWFKIADNDGTVTPAEFTTAFNGYDTNSNGTLDDQTDIAGFLDRKAL